MCTICDQENNSTITSARPLRELVRASSAAELVCVGAGVGAFAGRCVLFVVIFE